MNLKGRVDKRGVACKTSTGYSYVLSDEERKILYLLDGDDGTLETKSGQSMSMVSQNQTGKYTIFKVNSIS